MRISNECLPIPDVGGLPFRDRTKNDLGTPREIIDALESKFGRIWLDPCSNRWSVVDARISLDLDRGEDGLKADWLGMIGELEAQSPQLDPGQTIRPIFVNPPYGRGMIIPWVRKAIEETNRSAFLGVALLVPCGPSRKWYQAARAEASAMGYFLRRPRFNGGKHRTGQKESAIFWFGRGAPMFCDAMGSLCDVRILRHHWER